jgi:site-specific DNA-methyltransferase (adenine-specific)
MFNNKGKTVHPTQKPLALMEYFIKTYSLEWDLVLDFTCGSGTTLVACEKLNRKWIGIELEEKYCEIAKQRILGIK